MLQKTKKRIALVECFDYGVHPFKNPLEPKVKSSAFVSEYLMRLKTTGKRTVRFRVYSDESLLRRIQASGGSVQAQDVRWAIDQAALLAVRQVLDQL